MAPAAPVSSFFGHPDEADDLDQFTVPVSVDHDDVLRSFGVMELNDAKHYSVKNNRFIRFGVGTNLWQFVKLSGWHEDPVFQGNRCERTPETATSDSEPADETLGVWKHHRDTVIPPHTNTCP